MPAGKCIFFNCSTYCTQIFSKLKLPAPAFLLKHVACMRPGLGLPAQTIFWFKHCSNDRSPISHRIIQTLMDHNYIHDMVMTQSQSPGYTAAVLHMMEPGQQRTMWLHINIYWELMMKSSADSCKLRCTVPPSVLSYIHPKNVDKILKRS
jgi:hypothetical protein